MVTKVITGIFVLALLLVPFQTVQAGNAVVGSGTAASCTEDAFDKALFEIQTSPGGGGEPKLQLRRTLCCNCFLKPEGNNLKCPHPGRRHDYLIR